ncbi:hypothetical protein [Sulfurospirillum halorespirans]|uniref:Periplasmic protein n=1 Tax=Sulfurospirillum halorespirans DSM 13726 TaxID=1193502 RepID=A0A1D7TJK2_9BACT|nr:hypothetical protein [Sulfurospirillum halorespirans]AOO65054.1 hypothetical protein SHALO_1276 [Sulfurospirillum halorespirans DSM 13726]
MQVFSKVKLFAALLIAAMFVSGAMAAESKCGGEMNATKDAKEMKKPADAKCGGDKASDAKKPADAKCGAAKCGGEKK